MDYLDKDDMVLQLNVSFLFVPEPLSYKNDHQESH